MKFINIRNPTTFAVLRVRFKILPTTRYGYEDNLKVVLLFTIVTRVWFNVLPRLILVPLSLWRYSSLYPMHTFLKGKENRFNVVRSLRINIELFYYETISFFIIVPYLSSKPQQVVSTFSFNFSCLNTYTISKYFYNRVSYHCFAYAFVKFVALIC